MDIHETGTQITIIGLSSQFTGTVLYTLSDINSLCILTITSKLLYFFSLNCIAHLLPFSTKDKKINIPTLINQQPCYI